jgi:hypothetical protein
VFSGGKKLESLLVMAFRPASILSFVLWAGLPASAKAEIYTIPIQSAQTEGIAGLRLRLEPFTGWTIDAEGTLKVELFFDESNLYLRSLRQSLASIQVTGPRVPSELADALTSILLNDLENFWGVGEFPDLDLALFSLLPGLQRKVGKLDGFRSLFHSGADRLVLSYELIRFSLMTPETPLRRALLRKERGNFLNRWSQNLDLDGSGFPRMVHEPQWTRTVDEAFRTVLVDSNSPIETQRVFLALLSEPDPSAPEGLRKSERSLQRKVQLYQIGKGMGLEVPYDSLCEELVGASATL